MVRRYEQGEQPPLFVGPGSSRRGRSCSYSHSSWSSLERGSAGSMGHTGRGGWIVERAENRFSSRTGGIY